jgi:hypothetical protein
MRQTPGGNRGLTVIYPGLRGSSVIVASPPKPVNDRHTDFPIPRRYLTQLVNETFAVLGPEEASYLRVLIGVVVDFSKSGKSEATEAGHAA